MYQDDREDKVGRGSVKTRNVVYVVSQDLAKVSSLLPSNKNRSFLVHSLIKSLGLLSLSQFDSEHDDAQGVEESRDGDVDVDVDVNAEPERTRRVKVKVKVKVKVVPPRYASVQDLCAYHDRDYVDFVLGERGGEEGGDASSRMGEEFGIEDDCPPFCGMGDYVRLVAGATLTAAELLKSGEADVGIVWDGGRHHAQKSRAAGFCYVADCILAILSLKRAPSLPLSHSSLVLGGDTQPRRKARIMYLDFDLHFSDAVSECFHTASPIQNPSQVLIFSIHHTAPGFYPPSALSSLPSPSCPSFDPFTLSLPLHQGASAPTFARVWKIVEDVKGVFRPDYVVLQCGMDGLAGDPHGVWNWSVGGEGEKGSVRWCVGEVVRRWGVRVLLLGGGGYDSPNTARAWASLTSIAIDRPLPTDTPIPDHIAFPMYAPSFTLDVPAGNMRDENSEEYLESVEEVYGDVVRMLRERCQY